MITTARFFFQLFIVFFLLSFPVLTQAAPAGTCIVSPGDTASFGQREGTLTWECTADGAGAIAAKSAVGPTPGMIYFYRIDEGSTPCTDGYDLTLAAADSTQDILGGTCTNLTTSKRGTVFDSDGIATYAPDSKGKTLTLTTASGSASCDFTFTVWYINP